MGTLNRKIARRYGRAIDLDNFKADGSLETGAPEIYDSAGLLPTSGVANGTQAYVTANQKLYIRATGGWYNVATVNTTPTISSVADAGSGESPFVLATDGSTTTVITVTATDSEGFPLTFSAVANSGFNGLATVAQDSSVFTITPKSQAAATTTSGTLTFRASDGVNIASEIATFTLTFLVENSKFSEVLLKASGNNGTNTTLNDASTTNNTIATVGNTTAQAFTPYHPAGYSFEVVGNTDAIAIDSGYFTTNTTWWKSSGFTVEGWVNLTSSDNTAIFDNRQSSTTGFLFNYNNTNAKIAIYANGGWAGTFDTTVPRDGKWHYIALTMSGTSANLYVDGIKDSTTVTVANTSTYAYFGRSQNTLGAVQYTPRQSNACEGKYRDFKFTAGAQYTGATMTIPTSTKNSDSNTALFVTMSPFPKDISSNASTVTVLGTTNRSVADNPSPYDHLAYDVSSHGASVYFPGSTGDYVTLGASSPSYPNFGTGAYTIEMWIWPTADRSGALFTTHAQATASGMYFSQSTNGQVVHGSYIGGSTSGNISGSTNITAGNAYSGANAIKFNSWNHIAISRVSTSANQTRMFVNGQLKNTYTDGSNYSTYSYGPQIGQYAGGTVYPYQGYVSDLRVVKGTAVYTAEFTPPTSPLTAVTNTELLTCNDTANIFNAAGASNVITLGGDAKSSTSVKKYAGASILLDGSGDFITIEDGTNLDFGSEPFTMEGWYKADTTSGDHYIISSSGGTYNAGPSHFGINIYQGNWRVGGFNDKLIGGVGSGVNTGIDTNWHHFAWTHNNRQIQFFIDGAQVGSTVNVLSDTFDCGGSFVIGGYHSNTSYGNWDGNLEDIRITKGLSRYPYVPAKETLTSGTLTKALACHAASETTAVYGADSTSLSVSKNGTPTASDFAPAVGMKSVYFDGNDDWLTINLGSAIGTNDFCVEGWAYRDASSGTSNSRGIFSISDNTNGWSSSGSNISLQYRNSANGNEWAAFLANGQRNITDTDTVMSKWYHFVVQRNGGTSYVFIDGTMIYSIADTYNYSGKQYLAIGTYHSDDDWYGYISNLRVSVGSGSNFYADSFTPSTAELTA